MDSVEINLYLIEHIKKIFTHSTYRKDPMDSFISEYPKQSSNHSEGEYQKIVEDI